MIILVIEVSDFSWFLGAGFSSAASLFKLLAGAGRYWTPAAAPCCLPHSDVKSHKPPHWACSDPTCLLFRRREFSSHPRMEGWEVTRTVGGQGAERSWSVRQSQQLLYYQTHTQTHTHTRKTHTHTQTCTVSKHTHLGCNTIAFCNSSFLKTTSLSLGKFNVERGRTCWRKRIRLKRASTQNKYTNIRRQNVGYRT